ncbi:MULTISPECIES: ABC transporter ATP-binding protein [Staphylococcus]|uniref:ATP-binding cassette domain-containing protein n=1 Tax=Staphylococcus nepalensis TaxID=214473 RepID=A0A291JLS5_9STAP|nr:MULTISPECIES: ATP-binding cassette domain-containing protein [Staphylococcus]VDG67812.1 iron compound ABC transporter ATP-binding protein [Lacrimispora indolis]ATH60824.1 iron ABC transporter ATP-binding protein [Staphylococcus nepalensis]ATH65854.1 iron ABC transporter ATP-binding protein [Staphylococcus nepalensis]AWI45243.1 iron ABC transporter ATP-binding protein [Staphylococcus nepalensis]MBO1206601.1 ATP-binding cassette domain-containing protein [Staphylococcus nepalensis]
MISVQGLNKTIQDKAILKEINVDINKGRLTSIIGPNGAGKSTLLSAITRLIDFEDGGIEIENKSISDYKSNELAKKLSILKQSNHTELNITVEQLVNFGRFPYSKGHLKQEDKEQVEYALELLQLKEIRHRYLKTLSGGQRQRAYVAMTIAQDTDYILLDEPLNNLDMKHSVQIMQTLRQLAKSLNKTIVVVIHDINFASCYSDDIIALKDGEVIKASTKDDVIQCDTLRELYEMEVQIEQIRGQRICIYFDELTTDQELSLVESV